MLSFELSAIDFILVIAVVILLILYITKSSVKPPTEEKLPVGDKIPPKKLAATAASLKKGGKKRLSTQPQTDSPKCPHRFGYLKKLDKNAPIPDECLSCPRIMECFGYIE